MTVRNRGQGTSTRPLVRLSRPVYERLLAVQREQAAELERDVTFTEVIERLLARAEGFDLLAAHAQVVDLADRKPVRP